MIRMIAGEIRKLYRRPRTYLGYLGVLLLILPFLLAFHYGRPEDYVRNHVGDDFEVLGNFFNALFLARMLMEPSLLVFVPLFVCLVAGDLVAGEAAEGTLRALLVRPVHRSTLLLAKFAVAVGHAGALTLFLGGAGLGLGALFFGTGDLFLFSEGITVIPQGEALLRLAGAYAAGALAMAMMASLAFLLSTLVDNGLFASGGAMMALLVSGVVAQIPYFEGIRPYLFSTHMVFWQELLHPRVDWSMVAQSAAWLAGYSALCLGGALAAFRRKDILS